MNSGIYIITNILDNKVYIGKAKDCNKRLYAHKYLLKNQIHANSHLQNAWNLYGENMFTFEVLENYEEEFLFSMENWWCNMLDAHNRERGYNIEPTSPFGKSGHSKETREKIGKSNTGRVASEEFRKKLSLYKTGKKATQEAKENMSIARSKAIIQLTKSGEFIKEWKSASEAGKTLKISISNINSVARKEIPFAGGFIWVRVKK